MLKFSELQKKPFNLSKEDLEWVHETYDTLDIPHKIGQIMMPQCYNPIKHNLKEILKFAPGGVFLGMGISWKARQRRSAEYLQNKSKIPLLIAGDLEFGGFGGAINATIFSSQMGVAATNDVESAFQFGIVVGREGRAMGYNWTFSPLVDVNYNPQNPIVNVRSFGDRPELILKMAEKYIQGVQEAGLAATLKHWPGDGMDDRDQHLVTSHNSLKLENWRDTYGYIYQNLIDKGTRTIMSAHISLADYYRTHGIQEPDQIYTPASISSMLNIELLRKEMGFNGLIVSDATGMNGMLTHGKRDILLPRLIENGCDIQLFTHNTRNDFQILLEAIETGSLSESRLNEATLRVLALKASLQLHNQKKEKNLVPSKQELNIVGSREHQEWASLCATKSITLVKDTQKILPISRLKYKKILLIRAGDFGILSRKFKGYLKKVGFQVKELVNPKILKHTEEFDLAIYLISEPGSMGKNTLRIKWNQIGGIHWLPNKLPTICISLGNPYHLYDLPRIKTLINAYIMSPIVQEEIVNKIIGKSPFIGISPIDPFCGLEDAHL